MTVSKGNPVFVKLSNHSQPVLGFVVAGGGNIADVLTLQEGGHIHLHKGLKERQDGEDFGFLAVDAPEPKSAKAATKEKLVAEANAKLASGDFNKPLSNTLLPMQATGAGPNPDYIGGNENEEGEVESEDDEETEEDGEDGSTPASLAKGRTRSASGRKR
jgi:hypothetical protein